MNCTPPTETPIMFLAGEFGCTPHWYAGYCWKSSEPGQELKFYVYPWFMGYPAENPPFNAPPYCGCWYPLEKSAHAVALRDGAPVQETLFDLGDL